MKKIMIILGILAAIQSSYAQTVSKERATRIALLYASIRPFPSAKYCEQRMQYYPSGLPWNTNLSPSYQPFKYGGKEFVEMHGLDEYDSEARWYYPAIMRTTSMDPLCEKYYSTSPYTWCGNNPVSFVDPDGEDIYRYDEESGMYHRDRTNDTPNQRTVPCTFIKLDGLYFTT